MLCLIISHLHNRTQVRSQVWPLNTVIDVPACAGSQAGLPAGARLSWCCPAISGDTSDFNLASRTQSDRRLLLRFSWQQCTRDFIVNFRYKTQRLAPVSLLCDRFITELKRETSGKPTIKLHLQNLSEMKLNLSCHKVQLLCCLSCIICTYYWVLSTELLIIGPIITDGGVQWQTVVWTVAGMTRLHGMAIKTGIPIMPTFYTYQRHNIPTVKGWSTWRPDETIQSMFWYFGGIGRRTYILYSIQQYTVYSIFYYSTMYV